MLDSLLLRMRSGERMSFRHLLTSGHNKKEMVTSFMAVLELLKRQEMIILAADREDDIILVHPDHVSPDEWPAYMEEPDRQENFETLGADDLETHLEKQEEEAAYDN